MAGESQLGSIQSNFNVLVMDSSPSRGGDVAKILEKDGYSVKVIQRLEDFFSTLSEFVPHVIVWPFEGSDDFAESFHLVKNKLPESHVVVITEELHFSTAIEFYDIGIFDCIQYPFLDDRILLKSVYRAIERDFYFYRSEQIISMLEENGVEGMSAKASTSELTTADLDWFDSLDQLQTFDELILQKMKFVSNVFGGSETIYFKYLPNQRTVVASFSVIEDLSKYGNLGIRLQDEETPLSVSEMLADPHSIPSLKDFVQTTFNASSFKVMKEKVDEDFLGFYLTITQDNREFTRLEQVKLKLLAQVGKSLHIGKKYFRVNKYDEVTSVFQRAAFFDSAKEEVSRSRRTQMATSLVVLSIDQGPELASDYDVADTNIVLRAMAKILSKNSRINDIVGRIGPYDFGILLPHTEMRGGVVKGERLRMVIESADFSRAVKNSSGITVSVGVSEYPSHASDSEELFQRADEAMFEARRVGGNKTCESRPMGQFSPDFVVE